MYKSILYPIKANPKLITNKNANTSIIKKLNHVTSAAGLRRYFVPLCLITYSIQNIAFSKLSIGSSVNSSDTSDIASLYLQNEMFFILYSLLFSLLALDFQ